MFKEINLNWAAVIGPTIWSFEPDRGRSFYQQYSIRKPAKELEQYPFVFFSLWCFVSLLVLYCAVLSCSVSVCFIIYRMADRGEPVVVDLDKERNNVKRQIRAVERILKDVRAMKERTTTTSVSIAVIKDRFRELNSYGKRANQSLEILFDMEEDLGLGEADEESRAQFNEQLEIVFHLLNNMEILKKCAIQAQSLESDLQVLEDMLAADATSGSSCIQEIKKEMKEFNTALVESTIPQGEEIWGMYQTLKIRMQKAQSVSRAREIPSAVSTTIIKTEKERDFDTPKVNIPKFKGGIEAWCAFWGRFRAAVHDNEKLREPVKMAILLDLMDDPSLKRYLTSQSDGKPGRYQVFKV